MSHENISQLTKIKFLEEEIKSYETENNNYIGTSHLSMCSQRQIGYQILQWGTASPVFWKQIIFGNLSCNGSYTFLRKKFVDWKVITFYFDVSIFCRKAF